ncbi:MAG: hypothetical protein JMDDDDMK_02431 [Acidobacteria bacterium]|nr:hypothetical protein [Acidobacteriota bacterium]
MDLNIRLIHAHDFLKTTHEGELDLKTSKQMLLKLASENAAPRQYDILIDVRRATGRFTFTDVAELVNVMIEHRESFRSKLAILAPPESTLEVAKFMELYAGNRGFQVKGFRDFEEAMSWLMTSSDLKAGA